MTVKLILTFVSLETRSGIRRWKKSIKLSSTSNWHNDGNFKIKTTQVPFIPQNIISILQPHHLKVNIERWHNNLFHKTSNNKIEKQKKTGSKTSPKITLLIAYLLIEKMENFQWKIWRKKKEKLKWGARKKKVLYK